MPRRFQPFLSRHHITGRRCARCADFVIHNHDTAFRRVSPANDESSTYAARGHIHVADDAAARALTSPSTRPTLATTHYAANRHYTPRTPHAAHGKRAKALLDIHEMPVFITADAGHISAMRPLADDGASLPVMTFGLLARRPRPSTPAVAAFGTTISDANTARPTALARIRRANTRH